MIIESAKHFARASVFLLDYPDDWCLERLDHNVDFTALEARGFSNVQPPGFVFSSGFCHPEASYCLKAVICKASECSNLVEEALTIAC